MRRPAAPVVMMLLCFGLEAVAKGFSTHRRARGRAGSLGQPAVAGRGYQVSPQPLRLRPARWPTGRRVTRHETRSGIARGGQKTGKSRYRLHNPWIRLAPTCRTGRVTPLRVLVWPLFTHFPAVVCSSPVSRSMATASSPSTATQTAQGTRESQLPRSHPPPRCYGFSYPKRAVLSRTI